MKAPLALAVALLLGSSIGVVFAQAPPSAERLLALREARKTQLQASAFGQRLVLSSREDGNSASGEVDADLDSPFQAVSDLFRSGPAMCDMLVLHLNLHGCKATPGPAGEQQIQILVGPKRVQANSRMYRMAYTLHTDAPAPNVIGLTMSSPQGPVSTKDYRMDIEAVAVNPTTTFVHLSYSYAFGGLSKAAMQIYMATAGRSKIGFTVEGQDADGKPLHVGGQRGAIERNVMRYYFALAAQGPQPGADGATREERLETHLRRWFALTERYPEQLHELELDEYLFEKHQALAKPFTASP